MKCEGSTYPVRPLLYQVEFGKSDLKPCPPVEICTIEMHFITTDTLAYGFVRYLLQISNDNVCVTCFIGSYMVIGTYHVIWGQAFHESRHFLKPIVS